MSKESAKKKKAISAFSILFIILFVVFLISYLLNGQAFAPITLQGAKEPVDHVVKAPVSALLMSPYNGFVSAVGISIFVLILGGFLGIIQATGVLESGIVKLVKGSKGKETYLIVVLMVLFSLGGTSYGMAEETVAFYGVITAAMVAAGFDSLVAVGTICLGAGAGCLGSTVNPFAIGAAVDALNGIGIKANQLVILPVGLVLWITTLIACIIVVVKYAKKVQKDKGSTLLSLQELDDMKKEFSIDQSKGDIPFTGNQKLVLFLFAMTFIVMIGGFIPWQKLGINIFAGWSANFLGVNYGEWYFGESAVWFLWVGIIIAIIAKMSESEIVSTFMAGAQDILSVVLIIVVARAVSVLMASTHIDLLILDKASQALTGTNVIVFVIGSYLLYLFLSFLIPSTSGLAFVSIPIMGGLAKALGFSPEVMVMIFSAGCGLMNFITPTSGVVMGGLQMSKVNYSTWIKFMKKPMIYIAIINMIVLSIAMIIYK